MAVVVVKDVVLFAAFAVNVELYKAVRVYRIATLPRALGLWASGTSCCRPVPPLPRLPQVGGSAGAAAPLALLLGPLAAIVSSGGCWPAAAAAAHHLLLSC
jgi:hypothetical protein